MSYEALYEELAEVARCLEQNAVSLKVRNPKSGGTVNAISKASTGPCLKCDYRKHSTDECQSPQCLLCGLGRHQLQDCYVNPASTKYKGGTHANAFREKSGKKPPTHLPTVATAGGTIAVAAIKNGTLVQNNPTPALWRHRQTLA